VNRLVACAHQAALYAQLSQQLLLGVVRLNPRNALHQLLLCAARVLLLPWNLSCRLPAAAWPRS
jgi:hypothetical protein